MPEMLVGDRAPGFEQKLGALFAETTALAHQLRKMAGNARKGGDCPAGALGLLRILYQQGPQTVPGLARARGLSRQNIQVIVNRLHARSLVALEPNPAHKRSALVQLSDRARELVETSGRRELEGSEALQPHIPETRLVPAAALLRQIRQLLGGPVLAAPYLQTESHPSPAPRPAPKRRARRRTVAPSTQEPPVAEPSEPEDGEFPVTLL